MKNEWGVCKWGDQELFEKICLEGAQAGLSWALILAKREAYRRDFHGFDIQKCAEMSISEVEAVMSDERSGTDAVVKNRAKLMSVPHNARCVLKMLEEGGEGSFSEMLWGFVGGTPKLNRWKSKAEVPSKTDESEAMSSRLKQLGFKFVGPTTCYSLMQACGLVVDHPVDSPEWETARSRIKAAQSQKSFGK
eukprot:TRINITY_DN15321_c0_g1_i1.p1 TRINITY_DN15321_c0_g1~~TRINITY_DN15321_c0_g1_i1.p1  ORF type:complete len:192 (+),score=46.94 TRINITY_DN15321_c0_g1_i1:207-782(+)